MNIKKLTTADVTITLTSEEEHTPIKGNAIASGHDELDAQVEREITEELTYNEWAWCTAKVTVTYMGLEETEYLGCCNYESAKDFKENSGYYEDMVNTCIESLQKQLENLITSSATC